MVAAMSHPSKVKGSGFEREVVKSALEVGLAAKRAWGSNGEALGEHEEVDVLLEQLKLQCKRRKKLPAILTPSEHVDGQVVREDRGKTYIVLPFDKFLLLLRKHANNAQRTG
jgi:Holliday junction resolvase